MITHEIQQTQVNTIHFFKNHKKPYQNKQKTPYYTPSYHSSDDDDFLDQYHQQTSQNQRLQSYHVNQPDVFEP